MKVKYAMTENAVTVGENEPVAKAAELMGEKGIGSVVVESSDGNIAGILTDRDIVTRCVAKGLDAEKTRTADAMTKFPTVISPENSITECARIMAKNKIRRLPVCENGKTVGVISIGDLSKSDGFFAETASAFCDICGDYKS